MPTPKKTKASPLKKKAAVKKVPAAAHEDVKTAAVAPQAHAQAGKMVLIVEDEVPLSHALEMKLKNDGFGVHTVTNGVDALAEAKRGLYGIMLLDLIMPRMDGFTVLEQLKGGSQKIPVIVLSNLGQDEDRIKAKELGAVDYFVKSNTPIADIIRRVHDFF